MSRLGFKSVVYHGDACLGELDTVPVKDQNFQFPNNEIRIHHISPISERCPPLSILQTISSTVRCKLEPCSGAASADDQSPLINLHASCFHERKTAVVLLGDEEVHLVAMPSKQKKFPCFWCYSVPCGLYTSCLGMLNPRCLAIVFDLDETLIVANTMKSFEDRIEILRGWVERENDPIREAGMSAEMKRYVEDRALLKQYIENDCVVDGSKVYRVQQEEVLQLSDGYERVVRPVVRLHEKNIVLTRINPEVRDTSVLVRLRPAWEELKIYLTARGRKRFEVYVCTMAERDYALEMWRLLDPEAHLISSKQLMERVICVKSGARKSLCNVFQDGSCHPSMAMVIDDRLKVWEDKDQPHVHVVPPFTPYYAPHAEMANAVAVLCVVRNVACDVRTRFFREFDDNLLRKICELFYEDEMVNLPSAPDVSSYLMSEDMNSVPNGGSNAPLVEGMYGPETAHRLNQQDEKYMATHPLTNYSELKSQNTQIPGGSANVFGSISSKGALPSDKPSLLGAPLRQESSVTEFDADGKRRFPMINNSQDLTYRGTMQPPLLSRLGRQPPILPLKPTGGCLVEEDIGRGHINGRSPVLARDSDATRADKQWLGQNFVNQAYSGQEVHKQSPSSSYQQNDVGIPQIPSSCNDQELQAEHGKLQPSLSISVLQEIGRRCSSKVEFRHAAFRTSEELQFSVEVFFTGEKVGVGMGKTRKDAQQQAAENALRTLADKYVSYIESCSGAVNKDLDKHTIRNGNGFLWESDHSGKSEQKVEDGLPESNFPEVAAMVSKCSPDAAK